MDKNPDTTKPIKLQDYPEFLNQTRHLVWVAYCEDASALLARIESALRLANDYKEDASTLKEHLDDLKFLLANLPEAIKVEMGDVALESIRVKILELGKKINYQL